MRVALETVLIESSSPKHVMTKKLDLCDLQSQLEVKNTHADSLQAVTEPTSGCDSHAAFTSAGVKWVRSA
jgi:hypothetical protein